MPRLTRGAETSTATDEKVPENTLPFARKTQALALSPIGTTGGNRTAIASGHSPHDTSMLHTESFSSPERLILLIPSTGEETEAQRLGQLRNVPQLTLAGQGL